MDEADANPFRTESDDERAVSPVPDTQYRPQAVTSPSSDSEPVPASEKANAQPSSSRPARSSPPITRQIPQRPQKTDFCCNRDRLLHSDEKVEIIIADALKTSENATSPYITYLIRTGSYEARRRYSEFESLRSSLVKLYPTCIVPPIPSKQSVGDYALKQGRAREDVAMIARRKRMLQVFLNRIARHPVLSSEHVFHRFLDGEASWSEVLLSPPISSLPKNTVKAPSSNPTDEETVSIYAALPSPSSSHPLRRPDQRFEDSELFTIKFATHVSGPMERVTKRALKRWGELAQDHADLGALLNGFSLSEEGPLSTALEKTGQAIDTTYLSTTKLCQELEQLWAEPLHEYSQFASIIKKLLVYRHQKHVLYELTQDALENKREQLEEFEKSEREAQRLQEALARGSRIVPSTYGGSNNAESHEGNQEERSDREEDDEETHLTPTYLPTAEPPRRSRATRGGGLLNALSHSIHGLIDSDPETARRSGIGKTRDNIGQLEDGLQLSAQDLKYTSTMIQSDLDRFQRQKVADLRDMTINMARLHREWCKSNLAAWEEARREISLIEDHPNQRPVKAEATKSAPAESTSAGQETDQT